MMLRISTLAPPASRQWVMSICHRSFGRSAQNRTYDDRGRFCGWGVISPRRDSTGQFLAQRDDLILGLGGEPGRRGMRPPRARMQALLPFGAVTSQALIHPAP